ncbi:MAG: dihydropteroate synthase [Candidatus Gastranaerophilales bacterium]
MILIGENIHIVSKTVREALLSRDVDFILNLIKLQRNMDYIDLNVGPAKAQMSGIFSWLINLVESNSDLKISFDTTNSIEMGLGLANSKNSSSAFINSTSKDIERLELMSDLAKEHECNLIALTLSKETGIPKSADERLEIAFEIYEKCLEKGVKSEKIFFDPLILPICIEQSQAVEALNTIRMIKESFDPPVKTVIGLSNISNGCPEALRALINRVFGVLAYGAGLDAAIIDARDLELVRIFRMLETNEPENKLDELYLDLVEMVRDYKEFEDCDFSEFSACGSEILSCVEILLNKKIYSNSFTQI